MLQTRRHERPRSSRDYRLNPTHVLDRFSTSAAVLAWAAPPHSPGRPSGAPAATLSAHQHPLAPKELLDPQESLSRVNSRHLPELKTTPLFWPLRGGTLFCCLGSLTGGGTLGLFRQANTSGDALNSILTSKIDLFSIKNVFCLKLDAKSVPEALETTIRILLMFSIVLTHRHGTVARVRQPARDRLLTTPGHPL